MSANRTCLLNGMVILLIVLFVSSAQAQTVYSPPKYQYGQNGEIFYSGSDPNIQQGGANLYAPQWSRYRSDGRIIPLRGVHRQKISWDRWNWRNGSPFYYEGNFFFSDRYPYVELGQYGFNADDIRNEAYADLPRISNGPKAAEPLPQSVEVASKSESFKSDRKNPEKAIPLLTWARSAHQQGQHELVDALLLEAAKYDPAATAKMKETLSRER